MYLVNTQPTFSIQFTVDGTPADVGAVTVTVTRANGTAIATAVAAAKTGTGATTAYSYTLLVANNTQPDLIRLDWTEDGGQSVTTYVEIVGSLLFGEAEARSFDNSAMTSSTTYTDDIIAAGRMAVTEMLERHCKRSYIRRYCRVVLPGTGTSVLDLDCDRAQFRASNGDDVGGPARLRDIRSVIRANDGAAKTLTDIIIEGSKLILTTGTWASPTSSDPFNVEVEYVYGLSGADPEGVKRPALWLLRERLVPSDLNARATSYSDALGTLRFETPGRNGNISTIPEVNMWVKDQAQDLLVW